MTNYLEVDGKTYVPFVTGLKHPKLSWLIMMLNLYGIAHVVAGQSLQGPMLFVEQGTAELAQGILFQDLAVFTARTANFEEGPDVEITIKINDLPNDHEFFAAQIRGQKIDKIVAAATPEPEGQVIEITKDKAAPIDTLEVIEVEGKVIDNDGPETLEDITDEIKEHLVESQEADDEDDDDWGFDEVSLEAEEAVEAVDTETVEPIPDPPKKKKVKPEPKASNDPDFDDAEEAPARAAVLSGTEFLKADELLPFEDVQFPKVKLPIRMYDVNSSNISAIGAKITDDPLIATYYVRFKTGASVYRYNPVATADYNESLNEAVRRQQGIMEASVGSFYYHTVKVKAEAGEIKCQRLNEDGTAWVEVQPKAARTKEIKERAK